MSTLVASPFFFGLERQIEKTAISGLTNEECCDSGNMTGNGLWK